MKKATIFLVIFFNVFLLNAAKITIERNGLVKADGKEVFYLIKKNAIIGYGDFSWQTLDKKEIAFLKINRSYNNGLSSQGQEQIQTLSYVITFAESLDQAYIDSWNTFSVSKSIANILFEANMIENTVINLERERLFVLSYKGRINYNYPTKQENGEFSYNESPNNSPNTTNTNNLSTSDYLVNTEANKLVIKNNKVYYYKTLISYFSNQTDQNENTTLEIKNNIEKNTILATYKKGAEDWDITIIKENKKIKVLYNDANPMQDLFTYLIDNNYLKN